MKKRFIFFSLLRMSRVSKPSWLKLVCRKNEELVIGRCFKTTGLHGDPEWDAMIDVAVCMDTQGKITDYQEGPKNESIWSLSSHQSPRTLRNP